MNTGKFKLSCSKSGKWHFAYVKVKADFSLESQIINSITKPVNFDECEIDEIIYPDWFNAAIDGINQASKLIEVVDNKKITVEIICIKGVEVDTRYDDIRASAFLAVVNAFMGENINYSLDMIDNTWDICFDKEYNWNYKY